MLAAPQGGVFTAEQAADLDISPGMLSRRVASGRLFRIHQGVYSVVPPRLLSTHGRRLAAVLACGAGRGPGGTAGLSHLTAGIHTGLLTLPAPRIIDVTVTVAGHGRRARAGLRIHRSLTLRPGDVQRIYGIPTTSVARTMLDLTGVLSLDKVELAMGEAARLELLDLAELREQVAHNCGRPEAARLNGLIQAWDHIWSFTESQLEKLLLQALDAAGLPRPELQVWLDLRDGEAAIRADFLYRDARLILEADSWRWHAHRFERDSRRDQRAAAAGFQTLRITRRQVIFETDRVAATVATVHAERSARTPA